MRGITRVCMAVVVLAGTLASTAVADDSRSSPAALVTLQATPGSSLLDRVGAELATVSGLPFAFDAVADLQTVDLPRSEEPADAEQDACGGAFVWSSSCSLTFRGNPLSVSATGAGVGIAGGRGTIWPVATGASVYVLDPSRRIILSCSSAFASTCTKSLTVELAPGTPLTCRVSAWAGAGAGTFGCSSGIE